MDYDHCPIPSVSPAVSRWQRVKRRLPWLRRRSGRLGLQAKLVVCFMALLAIAVSVSAWTFVNHSTSRLVDLLGEQARQLSYALSLASRVPIENAQWTALQHIGQDMLKSRNVLYVAFFNAELEPVIVTSRDAEFTLAGTHDVGQSVRNLMQVRQGHSRLFGDFVEVTAPVLSISSPAASKAVAPGLANAVTAGGKSRLLGYVSIGLSQAQEQAHVQAAKFIVLGIGGMIGLLVLPVASVLVHRIFLPIRQLVAATDRIARGELDVKVAIHRPDVIGTLARSFNEMVIRVKEEQDALEEKVQRRTSELELANRRLSREIAEKEDFLRAVSHDLSAPLRNISGMTSMLLMKHRSEFQPDVVHRLERIQKNVDVESDLIGELLELSRIKTRRHKMESVDLHSVVEDLRGMFENDLTSRKIELVVENKLPVLNGERARFRQVFQNLIDNAIKYMGDGRVRRITIGSKAGPHDTEFYVSDTGMGIDREDIDKVFCVFRRGKNTGAQNVAGKGVGLASVKSILDTYGGSISVESKPGVGTTFRFSIGSHINANAIEDSAQANAA